RLSNAIKDFFRKYDGRGEHCQVDHPTFQDYEYLLAYPSEYPDRSPEWLETGQLDTTTIRRLTFLVIFIFKKNGGSVDVYVEEPIEVKRQLVTLWAKEILSPEHHIDTKTKRTYNLTPFRTREHTGITYPPDSRVTALAVHKLKFSPRHNP